MKVEYYEEMLEQEAINRYLNMIANYYNGELARIFEEKYINKDKEIERLNNIIKEAREYINIELLIKYRQDFELIEISHIKKILEILDKGDKK